MVADDNPYRARTRTVRKAKQRKYGVGDTVRDDRFEEFRQLYWLRRSRHWMSHRDTDWVARRILGIGASGLVGLFDYAGPENRQPLPVPHFVAKQTSSHRDLHHESLIMRALMESANSDHIIKLYKAAHRDGGSGASEPSKKKTVGPHPPQRAIMDVDRRPFNPNNDVYNPLREISRIYMEYCEGGSLQDIFLHRIPSAGHPTKLMLRIYRLQLPVPEEYIWRIFHCMAKGLKVLESGTEGAAGGWVNPIVHFDLKLANVLIGDHDQGDHSALPVIKLADFGQALMRDPNIPETDQVWLGAALSRGTPKYKPPETLGTSTTNRPGVGTKSDVWCLGAVIYRLMYGDSVQGVDLSPLGRRTLTHQTFNATTRTYPVFNQPPYTATFESFGPDLRARLYSMHLIELVHRCLARVAVQRPDAQVIIDETARIVAQYDNRRTIFNNLEPMSFKHELGEPSNDQLAHLGLMTAGELQQYVTGNPQAWTQEEPNAVVLPWHHYPVIANTPLHWDDLDHKQPHGKTWCFIEGCSSGFRIPPELKQYELRGLAQLHLY